MEEVKKNQVMAAGWAYTQKRDILALDQTPVAPSDPRTYMGSERLGRTKVGKRRQKQIAQEGQRNVDCPVPPAQTSSVASQTTHPEWPSDWLKELLRWPKASRRTNAEIEESQDSEFSWPTYIDTVPRLWQEWRNLIDRGPPLKEGIPEGIRWVNQKTSQRFDRVRPVLDAILGTSDHSETVTQLEVIRVQKRWSPQKLSKELLLERAGRLAGPK